MTMRNPLDREVQAIRPTFDPAKSYRYTWPGQPPKVVAGDELAAICKGANHEMLAIEEVSASPSKPPNYPPALDDKRAKE